MPSKKQSNGPRVLFWDIETTNLSASFGTILCIGYKWADQPKPKLISILDSKKGDMLDDRDVVDRFASVFNQCDYHVTWYGDRFDQPFVQTKLMKHGLAPLAPKLSIDLWKTARYGFKLHSNRLAAWQQYLEVPHSKTPIDFASWLAAAHGNKKAMAEVLDHCEKDVFVLEEIFDVMRPWVKNLPNNNLFSDGPCGCPTCGSLNFERRGFKVATARVYQQYQCQDCGRWWRDKKALIVAPQAGGNE